MDISILTFNIWDAPFWVSLKRHTRMRQLGVYLRTHNPDIICLQESFDVKHREEINNVIGKRKYYATNHPPYTRRVFFQSFDFTGGLVIFSKFPIIQSSFVPFKSVILMGLIEYVMKKGFLEVVVKTPEGPMRVITTHLYSFAGAYASSRRMQQLSQIIKHVETENNKMPAIPTILTGDLNEDKITIKKPFAELLNKAEFIDSSTATHQIAQPTYRPENQWTNTRFNRTTAPLRLDYILLNNLKSLGLNPISNHVLRQPTPPISDHDPVIVTLRS